MFITANLNQVLLENRKALESLALLEVSAEDYWQLVTTIDETPSEDLIRLIEESGVEA